MREKWGTFEILTMWKHNTNPKLVYALAHLKCTYLVEILAWTLDWVFIMVSFYSDAELMHKLAK